MLEQANTWTLVLAAGEGTRLHSLTTCSSGTPIPKQFCSLFEGPSLLHEALKRAHALSDGIEPQEADPELDYILPGESDDLSRDIVPGQESALRAVRVPSCGWSDLGTPKRVAEAVYGAPRAGRLMCAALRP